MSFLGITLGSPYAKKQASQAAQAQSDLAGLQSSLYKNYAVPAMDSLQKLYNSSPGYFEGIYQRGRSAIGNQANNAVGQTLNRLAGTGMMNSGQANNLLAGIAAGQADALGNLAFNTNQAMDERQRQILSALLNIATGQGAQALGGYGQVGQAWSGLANHATQEALAPFSLLGGLAGSYLGGHSAPAPSFGSLYGSTQPYLTGLGYAR